LKTESDLRAIADLGFSHVVVAHEESPGRSWFIDQASDAGLSVVAIAQPLDVFIRTGAEPTGGEGVHAWVQRQLASADGQTRCGVLIDGGRTDAAVKRAEMVADSLASAGLGYAAIGGMVPSARLVSVAVIDVAGSDVAVGRSPLGNWSAEYHSALAEGRTAGLILNRWRRLSNGDLGLFSDEEWLSPATEAAVRLLVLRARSWGPHLHGLHATSLQLQSFGSEGLRGVLFSGDHRRLVMVFNPSTEAFARGEIQMPSVVGDASAVRAVEIPPASRQRPGQIIAAAGGRIVIPISLKPGDAVLFELF
jgi:hypothetical protein